MHVETRRPDNENLTEANWKENDVHLELQMEAIFSSGESFFFFPSALSFATASEWWAFFASLCWPCEAMADSTVSYTAHSDVIPQQHCFWHLLNVWVEVEGTWCLKCRLVLSCPVLAAHCCFFRVQAWTSSTRCCTCYTLAWTCAHTRAHTPSCFQQGGLAFSQSGSLFSPAALWIILLRPEVLK